jgi:glycoside/pentoside/hexuronide:cation symporter, GPH family
MRTLPLSRLTNRQLVSMGLPSFVTASLFVPLSFLIQPFYADTLGLGLAVVGQILMFGRFLDVLIDPVIGWISDHTRTRWGRRRPWMAVSVPLLVAGIWLLFSPERPVTPLYLLGALTLFYFGVTLFLIPYHAWGAEISNDYHERSRIVAMMMWMTAAAVPLTALLPSTVERVLHWDVAGQLHALALLYVVLAPLTVAALLANVPEVQASATRRARSFTAALRQYGHWLRQPDFQRVSALSALTGCSEAANTGLYVFFVVYALRLDHWATSLLLVQTVVGLVSIPLWLRVTRRLGKSKALRTVLVIDTAVPLFALLIPAGTLIPLAVFMVVRGLTWGAEYMVLRSVLADQIHRHASRTGDDSAATSFAMFQLAQKIAAAVAIGVIYWTLARLGFDPAHGHHGGSGLVRVAFAVLPTVFSGVSLLLARGIEPAQPEAAMARGRTESSQVLQ